jgi:hypothetical protein
MMACEFHSWGELASTEGYKLRDILEKDQEIMSFLTCNCLWHSVGWEMPCLNETKCKLMEEIKDWRAFAGEEHEAKARLPEGYRGGKVDC